MVRAPGLEIERFPVTAQLAYAPDEAYVSWFGEAL
jgi:hypothetical protein